MTTPPPPPEQSYGAGSSDDKTMAQIAHFGMILFGAIPAAIIYFTKGNESAYVKEESRKAFNFSIGVTIGLIAVFFISIMQSVIIGSTALGCLLSLVSLALWISLLVFGIMNGIKINNGETTQYPFEFPILK